MKQNYIDRAMRARDPRFAKIANRLGYTAPPVRALRKADDDDDKDKAQLTREYEALTGDEPDGRWSVGTLEEKVAQARERYGRRDMRAED